MSNLDAVIARYPEAAGFADLFVGMDDDDPSEFEAFVADVAGRVKTARSTYVPDAPAPAPAEVQAALERARGTGDTTDYFRTARQAAGVELSPQLPERRAPKVLSVEEALEAKDMTAFLNAQWKRQNEQENDES